MFGLRKSGLLEKAAMLPWFLIPELLLRERSLLLEPLGELKLSLLLLNLRRFAFPLAPPVVNEPDLL